LIIAVLFVTGVVAQDSLVQNVSDTLLFQPDSLMQETMRVDSVSADTIVLKKKSSNSMDAKVDYEAKDSIRFDIKSQKVYLFREAQINYEEIDLKAAFVELDFNKNVTYAE
jgi:hypothetical protein